MAYLEPKGEGDKSMPGNQWPGPGVGGGVLGDPRDTAKARLLEAQSPEDEISHPPERRPIPAPALRRAGTCAFVIALRVAIVSSISQSDLAPPDPAAQTRRPRRTFLYEATKPTTRTFLLRAHAEITAELVRNDPWSCAMDVADHVEDVDDKFIRPCCYLVEVAEVLDEQVRWLLVGGRRRSSIGRHARTNERNYCVSPESTRALDRVKDHLYCQPFTGQEGPVGQFNDD